MKRLSGGIDIGGDFHHMIILDDKEQVLYQKRIPHHLKEMKEIMKELTCLEKKEMAKLSFVLEGKNGYSNPLDRLLLLEGFTLYNVDNYKLKRFREAFAGERKDDNRDALMLSKMLNLKEHINTKGEKVFIEITKPSVITESLKLLSRHQQVLIDEKVRLTNRLGKKLLEVCPELLTLGKLKYQKLIAILSRYPDFSRYHKITPDSLLKIPGIGKKQAPRLLAGLHGLAYMPEMTAIYKTIISSYAKRILQLQKEIKGIDQKMDQIGGQDKTIRHLKSMPAVGTKLASRFTGEIGDISRFPSERNLAIYCGIACVNNASGKTNKTKAVYKANKIAKQTLMMMAGGSIRVNPQCRNYYLKKRSEGKKHNHALRCLARQMIKVIYRMLTEDRDYQIKKEALKAA
jgi:transposase